MALVIADRVQETSTTTGTGTLTLAGAVTGFQTFSSAIGNGNTTWYGIANPGTTEWEVGLGTVSAGALARTTVYASSNAGAAVNFSAGTKNVFVGMPSSRLSVTGGASTVLMTDASGGAVVSANSASDALRVTQIGAGNSLLIEDQASVDSTPFVIDTNGNVAVGNTAVLLFVAVGGGSMTPKLQVLGTDGDSPNMALGSFENGSRGTVLAGVKSRSATIGGQTVVQSGDSMITLLGEASDGSAYIRSASISMQVDGTPATGSMPGRVVLSTTASGSSSPTEALRIDSAQRVGIGSAAAAGETVRVVKNMTGATGTFGVRNLGTIQSDATGTSRYFHTDASTAAAAFTAAILTHYNASQSTIGAGSAVTTQHGFNVESSLTGATNNYGFRGQLAAGTGRYNTYNDGTADNYMAGALGLGSPPTAGVSLSAAKSITGAATASGVSSTGQIQSDVTTAAYGFNSLVSTAAASFTVPQFTHFNADQGAIGSGSVIGTQVGFRARSTLSGGGSNVGFWGDLASGYNLYMAGVAANYMAGPLGVGQSASGGQSFRVAKNITGLTDSSAVVANGPILSDVTSSATMFQSAPTTQATTFTLATLRHFQANPGSFGSGSAVTNQYGFAAESAMTGATNNYGFYGNIASASNRWNFFANGSANNAFAGNTKFGATTAPTAAVDVSGSILANAITVADSNGWLGLRSYTVATLPSASTSARLIYVSDGTSNKRLAVSDGTNWRWPDGAIVS